MKNKKIIYILVIFCMNSCNNDYKARIASLHRALKDCQDRSVYEAELTVGIHNAINSALSKIDLINKHQDELDNIGRASKNKINKKIAQIQEYIIQSQTEISDLKILLSQKDSASDSLLSYVTKLQEQLNSKETYIKRIKEEIDKKVGFEVNIFEITHYNIMKELTKEVTYKIKLEYSEKYGKMINNLQHEISKNDTTIERQTEELALKDQEIERIVKEAKEDLKELEDSLSDLSDKEQAKIYYRMAKDQEYQANKFMDIIGRSRKKASLIMHALMYYKKATKLGKNCEDDIKNLKENYRKYFRTKSVKEILKHIEKLKKKNN